jgi:hypothetical protein
VSIAGLEAGYNRGVLSLAGELIISVMTNTAQYNTLPGNDAGKSIRGMYTQIAFNVLQKSSSRAS